MGFIKKFRICLCIVAVLAISCFAQTDCSKIDKPLCDRLRITAADSTVFSIGIAFLRPPRDNMGDTAYWARLNGQVGEFFATYEILDSLGNRMPVPDSIDFTYVDVFATKKTIIEFVKESYIQEAYVWEENGPAGVFLILPKRSINSKGFESGYLVNGRRSAQPIGFTPGSPYVGKRPLERASKSQ